MIDTNSTVTGPTGVQKVGRDRSPALPKEKDASFNLRDRLNDILLSEKYIIEGYTTGSKEVLCQQLYNIVNENLSNSKLVQRNLFEQIFNLGEYQADVASDPQIADALDMFTKYKAQLPYPHN